MELLPVYAKKDKSLQQDIFGPNPNATAVKDQLKFKLQIKEKSDYIKQLERTANACTRCTLGKTARKKRQFSVLSKGNPEAKVVIVAEAPGRDELVARVPLVGPSGRLWHEMLDLAGIDDKLLYHTNALLCKVDKTEQSRLDSQLKACAPYLEHQLFLIKPKFIIALGKTAMDRLGIPAGHSPLDESVTLCHYNKVPWTWVAHPAYTLRNLEYKDTHVAKLKAIKVLMAVEYGISVDKIEAVREDFD